METNKSGEINSNSDFGKHDLSTNVNLVSVICDSPPLNCKDIVDVVQGPNIGAGADLRFPIDVSSFMERSNMVFAKHGNQLDLINRGVNGQVVNGKIDESPNVAEVNMESFKCHFPSLNGRISHNFHVKDLTSKG